MTGTYEQMYKIFCVGLESATMALRPQHRPLFERGPPDNAFVLALYFFRAAKYILFRENLNRQLVLHHLCTLALMAYSLMHGLTRSGSYTLAIHDLSDVFLVYAKQHKNNPWISTSFVAVFAYTRLYLFPTVVLHGFWNSDAFHAGSFACLVSLQCLHLYWFYRIVHIVMRKKNNN